MRERIISIIDYGHGESEAICGALAEKLRAADFCPIRDSVEGAELIIVVGGDGSFLWTLERFGFPAVPFAGINTGHLGFFQELSAGDIDEFIDKYLCGQFQQQTYRTVVATIEHAGGKDTLRGLNEFVIRAGDCRLAHFDIYIEENLVERFSGDGVVISTPAGSTAYNYALGGSIVDPRLDLLQLTPIAPVNTTAYRSFTSGIVLPPNLTVHVIPDLGAMQAGGIEREIQIALDGTVTRYADIRHIEVGLSDRSVTLLRFKDYEFWNTVKQKLLTL